MEENYLKLLEYGKIKIGKYLSLKKKNEVFNDLTIIFI